MRRWRPAGVSAAVTEQLLLEGGLFAFKRGDLLLETGVLGLLVREVALHFFFDAVQLVGERLPHILGLHGEHAFESVLLALEDLHFFLMEIHFLVELTDHFLKAERAASPPARRACPSSWLHCRSG